MRLILLAAPLVAALCVSGFYDAPDQSQPGGITAKVSPIADLETAIVFEPAEYRVYEATVDRAAGTFRIQGLPPGKYDVILKFKDTVAEGVTLDVEGGYEKIPDADMKEIQNVTWQEEDFFNQKTITRLGGNSRSVRMIIEQVRDKPFFDPAGTAPLPDTMKRRIEFYDMRKAGKMWTIYKRRHLFEERHKTGTVGATVKFITVPALGGIRVTDEVVTLPDIKREALKDTRAEHFYTAKHRR